MDTPTEVMTIGHSTLTNERFLELLSQTSVTAIADVRTSPYSRYSPHFNREFLQGALRQNNIAYVFLGEELGGRPKDKRLYRNDVADYEKMAATEEFERGLERVLEGAKKYRVAMMCSEQDPLECHRCLLVGRALHERGVAVKHILSGGQIVGHNDIETRLMEISGKSDIDLFEPPLARLAAAYRDQATKVAFTERISEPQKLKNVEPSI